MVRPSVTIVVRTICDEASEGPQYDYRWPGIAYHPFQRHAPTIRRLQYLRMLRALDADTARTHVCHVLASADLFLAYTLISEILLETGNSREAQNLANSCFVLSNEARLKVLLAAQNDLVSRTLINLRQSLHDANHRFLLALLLNVFDRNALLQVVAREYQDRDPVRSVIQWLREMTGHTPRFPNLLSLDFNETVFEMLELMWRGQTLHAVLATLTERHGAEAMAGQHAPLSALFDALRECALFAQVFRDLDATIPA